MKIFVYGTLKVGGRFSHKFNGMRVGVQDAKMPGFDMYDLGMFPGIIPMVDAHHHTITGEVHEYPENLGKLALEYMDRIEGYREDCPHGSFYIRDKHRVRYEDGTTELVWVYYYNQNVRTHKRIVEGVWNINKEEKRYAQK